MAIGIDSYQLKRAHDTVSDVTVKNTTEKPLDNWQIKEDSGRKKAKYIKSNSEQDKAAENNRNNEDTTHNVNSISQIERYIYTFLRTENQYMKICPRDLYPFIII